MVRSNGSHRVTGGTTNMQGQPVHPCMESERRWCAGGRELRRTTHRRENRLQLMMTSPEAMLNDRTSAVIESYRQLQCCVIVGYSVVQPLGHNLEKKGLSRADSVGWGSTIWQLPELHDRISDARIEACDRDAWHYLTPYDWVVVV